MLLIPEGFADVSDQWPQIGSMDKASKFRNPSVSMLSLCAAVRKWVVPDSHSLPLTGISAEIVARPALIPSIHEEPMNPARLILLVESWEVSRRERTPEDRFFTQISRLPSKASCPAIM